jgi:hypothetical protein
MSKKENSAPTHAAGSAMRRKVARAILGIGFAAACSSALGAAGWTDFGPVITLEQNPANVGSVSNQMLIVVSVTTNPSNCAQSTGFYFEPTDDRQKRLFAMLMAAQLAGRNVRIYTTGVCHTVGYSHLDGVVVQ